MAPSSKITVKAKSSSNTARSIVSSTTAPSSKTTLKEKSSSKRDASAPASQGTTISSAGVSARAIASANAGPGAGASAGAVAAIKAVVAAADKRTESNTSTRINIPKNQGISPSKKYRVVKKVVTGASISNVENIYTERCGPDGSFIVAFVEYATSGNGGYLWPVHKRRLRDATLPLEFAEDCWDMRYGSILFRYVNITSHISQSNILL
jgi:hypothetical protein